jgi:uncharacterized membrane protein YkvA (DUF1232 family)
MFKRIVSAVRLYRQALKQPNASPLLKWLPIVLIVYVVWPVDLLPDILPLIGQIDDIGVIIGIAVWLWNTVHKFAEGETAKKVIDVQAVKRDNRK